MVKFLNFETNVPHHPQAKSSKLHKSKNFNIIKLNPKIIGLSVKMCSIINAYFPSYTNTNSTTVSSCTTCSTYISTFIISRNKGLDTPKTRHKTKTIRIG